MHTRARRTRPNGFTLIELLLVLTLVVAALALVLPVSIAQLRISTLDEAATQVESAMTLARAESMRTGKVLELQAKSRGQSAATRLVVYAESSEDQFSLLEQLQDIDASTSPSTSETNLTDASLQSRLPVVDITLPRSVKLIERVEDAAKFTRLDGFEGDLAEFPLLGFPGERDSSVLLALFLPDGQVIADRPILLDASQQFVMQVQVGRHAGKVRIRPIAVPEAGEALPADGALPPVSGEGAGRG